MMTKNTTAPIIRAFITNLGKYNEGELVGEWHDFPTTREKLMQTFKEIGIDGVNYEEFFITDYDIEIKGVYDRLSEYESLDELNYLAHKMSDLGEYELEIFEAALELGDYSNNLQSLINLIDNLNNFDYLYGVHTDYDLGYYWINESGAYDTESMGFLYNYVDYETFGRHVRLDEGGIFTNTGYIRDNGDSFYEEYDGTYIPDEYKVYSYSDLPGQMTLKLTNK